MFEHAHVLWLALAIFAALWIRPVMDLLRARKRERDAWLWAHRLNDAFRMGERRQQ